MSAKTDHRPEFQHMNKDSYKNLFDVVLVWKLDRFARNRYDSAYYKNILKKNGVRLVSIRVFSTTTKKLLDELEEQKSNLETELFEVQIKHPVLTKDQILFALYNYRTLDLSSQEGKQRLIDGFVNSIYLYDDRFVITFNYKGQIKTVSFEQLNSSSLTSKGSPRN